MKQVVVLVMLALTMFINSLAIADDPEELSDRLRASGVVGDNETILIASNVYFYPNKKGFGMFSGGKGKEKGHIVFTDKGFSVVSWSRSDERFDVLYEAAYTELESSEISGNSPMVRLVTKEKGAKKHNSFEIMDTRNAFAPNPQKTKEADKIIEAGMQGLDVTKVAGTSAAGLSATQMQAQQQRMLELEERIQRLEEGSPETPSTSSSECDCKCPE